MDNHSTLAYVNEINERLAYNESMKEFIGEDLYNKALAESKIETNLKKIRVYLNWEDYTTDQADLSRDWAKDLEEYLSR
jgi:hypothetical protein